MGVPWGSYRYPCDSQGLRALCWMWAVWPASGYMENCKRFSFLERTTTLKRLCLKKLLVKFPVLTIAPIRAFTERGPILDFPYALSRVSALLLCPRHGNLTYREVMWIPKARVSLPGLLSLHFLCSHSPLCWYVASSPPQPVRTLSWPQASKNQAS